LIPGNTRIPAFMVLVLPLSGADVKRFRRRAPRCQFGGAVPKQSCLSSATADRETAGFGHRRGVPNS
jgi:hypothetical protein